MRDIYLQRVRGNEAVLAYKREHQNRGTRHAQAKMCRLAGVSGPTAADVTSAHHLHGTNYAQALADSSWQSTCSTGACPRRPQDGQGKRSRTCIIRCRHAATFARTPSQLDSACHGGVLASAKVVTSCFSHAA